MDDSAYTLMIWSLIGTGIVTIGMIICISVFALLITLTSIAIEWLCAIVEGTRIDKGKGE